MRPNLNRPARNPYGADQVRGFAAKSFLEDLNALFPEAKTVFDLGGYEGGTIAEFLEVFPNAMIHSFEQFVPYYAQQCFCHEITAFLQQRGFWLFDFYNFAYCPDGRLGWGDALFLRDA